jgi:hypothetical protein
MKKNVWENPPFSRICSELTRDFVSAERAIFSIRNIVNQRYLFQILTVRTTLKGLQTTL